MKACAIVTHCTGGEWWGHTVEWPDDMGIPLSALQRLAKEQAGKAQGKSA